MSSSSGPAMRTWTLRYLCGSRAWISDPVIAVIPM